MRNSMKLATIAAVAALAFVACDGNEADDVATPVTEPTQAVEEPVATEVPGAGSEEDGGTDGDAVATAVPEADE